MLGLFAQQSGVKRETITVTDAMAHDVEATVDKIRPLLAGRHPFVPGAVLADLAARWIAGHTVPDDPEGEKVLREEILQAHVTAIRELLGLYGELVKHFPRGKV